MVRRPVRAVRWQYALHQVIGSGIPLFDGPFDPAGFALASTRTFDTGVAIVTYTRK